MDDCKLYDLSNIHEQIWSFKRKKGGGSINPSEIKDEHPLCACLSIMLNDSWIADTKNDLL